MTIRTCASTAVCTDLWHSFLGIYLLTIPRHGVTHLDRIRAGALTHDAPACVLLCLAKVLVFEPLQPEAEPVQVRSEEHTSELQSLMRISYAVFCLKKQISTNHIGYDILSKK